MSTSISRCHSRQGRSQDSVNGGAQLGAVTRAYIAKIINRERWVSSGSFIAHPSRTCEARHHLAGVSVENFSGAAHAAPTLPLG